MMAIRKVVWMRLILSVLMAAMLTASGAASSDAADVTLQGMLCLRPASEPTATPECLETSADQIPVQPAEAERTWVWKSSDSTEIVVGSLKHSSGLIEIGQYTSAVEMEIRGAPEKEWPSPYELLIELEDSVWIVPLPATASPIEVRGPAGKGQITVSSLRHLPELRKGVRFAEGESQHLGIIQLRPAPSLRLEIVDSEGAPIAGSLLTSREGESLAVSDPTGRVVWEADGPLPATVIVSSSGFAPRTLDILNRNRDFGPAGIQLKRGATVVIELERALDQSADIEVLERYRDEAGQRQMRVIASGVLPAGDRSAELNGVPTGKHQLLLRGSRSLEQFSIDLEVGDVDREDISIDIAPFVLHGFVTIDGEPPAGAEVTVRNGWNGTVITDQEGRFYAPMWQKGGMSATVKVDALDFQAFEPFELSGNEDVEEIRFDFADLEIRGRVFDIGSGAPLPDARLIYSFEAENRGGMGFLPLERDGTFRRRGFAPGRYELTTRIEGYLPWKTELFLNSTRPRQEVDVALERGSTLHIVVVDDQGRPQHNAVLVENFPSTVRAVDSPTAMWTTDAEGRGTVPMREGELRNIWVLSPSGGLANATIGGDVASSESEPVRLTVPPAAGDLLVRAFGSRNEPVTGSSIAIRWNGAPVPSTVMNLLANFRAVDLRFDSVGQLLLPSLPQGRIDLWIVRNSAPVSPPAVAPDASLYFAGGTQIVDVRLPSAENGRTNPTAGR